MMQLAQRSQAVARGADAPPGVQPRHQPGPRGRGRHRRPRPHAHRPALGRATPTSCRCWATCASCPSTSTRPTPCCDRGSPRDARPGRLQGLRRARPLPGRDRRGGRRAGRRRAFIAVTGAKRVAVGHDVRLSSPEHGRALLAEGAWRPGADVVELGLAATEMLYFAVAEGGLRRGRLHHRQPQPARVHRGQDGPRRRGAAVGRRPASPRSGASPWPGRPATPAVRASLSRDRTCSTASCPRACASWTRTAIRGLRVVMDAANGMAGRVPAAGAGAPGHRRRCPTSSIRTGASPTTSPTRCCPRTASSSSGPRSRAGRRPGHRLRRRRRPLLLHRRHRRVRGRRLPHRAAGPATCCAAHGPSTVIYDLRASWAVRDTILAAGGTPDEYRVGHAFIKRAHARARRAVRRRGERPLLLPRLLLLPTPGWSRAAGAGAAVATRGARCPSWWPASASGTTSPARSTPASRIRRAPWSASRERYADGASEPRWTGCRWGTTTGTSTSGPPTPSRSCASTSSRCVSEADMERRRDEVLAVIRGDDEGVG